MSDLLTFFSILLGVLLVYMAWRLRGINWKDYFSTDDGKKILSGIAFAILFCAVIVLLSFAIPSKGSAGTWFNDATLYAGLDHTKKISPMCEPNSVDDRGTSNLGLALNVWESESGKVRVNTKYTHHSCALGADAQSYDAAGVELEWKVWERNK